MKGLLSILVVMFLVGLGYSQEKGEVGNIDYGRMEKESSLEKEKNDSFSSKSKESKFATQSVVVGQSFDCPGVSYPGFSSVEFKNQSDKELSFWPVFNQKDFSSKDGLKDFILAPYAGEITDEVKSLATWYFVRKYRYHWPSATADGLGHNPLTMFNSIGYGLCDDSAHTTDFIVERIMGLSSNCARVWGLSGHVVPEVYYNGGWHQTDADVAYYTSQGNLSIAQLEGPYNYLIDKVPGYSGVAAIYSSTSNNYSVAGTWSDNISPLKIVLLPGEKFTVSRAGNGKFWAVIYRDTPPHAWHISMGKHTINDVVNNLSHYQSSGLSVNNGKLELTPGSTSGSVTINLRNPYIITDGILEVHYEGSFASITSSVMLDYITTGVLRADLGDRLKLETSTVPTQLIQLQVGLNNGGARITGIIATAEGQVSDYSLPDLVRGDNNLNLISDDQISTPDLSINLAYTDLGNIQAAYGLEYDPVENVVTWSHDGSTPWRFNVIISRDQCGLFPVQPSVSEKLVTTKYLDLDTVTNLGYFITQGQSAYICIESQYGYNQSIRSETIPIVYKQSSQQSAVEDWAAFK